MNSFKEESINSYTYEQKINWFGTGEWGEEFDVVKFYFKEYKCMVFRVVIKEPCVEDHYFGGHFCGYVFLDSNHSLFGENFQNITIDCHGGISFSEYVQEQGAHLIGFDCAHSGDYVPSLEKFREENGIETIFPLIAEFKNLSLFYPVYRDIEY